MTDEPKFCKDCKHYERAGSFDMCHAKPHRLDLVTGKPHMEFADIRRDGICGASGALWEGRSPVFILRSQAVTEFGPLGSPDIQPRPWWRFWK